MEIKTCKKCGIEKTLDNYRKQKYKDTFRYCSWCKKCEKEYNANYNKTNKKRIEYMKKYHKKYNEEHKEQAKERRHKYYIENIDKIKEKYYKNNEVQPYWKKEWYKAYRRSLEYKESRNKYLKNRIKSDEVFRYKVKVRKFLCRAFYDKTFKKNDELKEIVGCSYNEFIKHLYNSFLNNYGIKYNENNKVNIDHIIPLKEAKTIEEVKKLNHYTNLQLLKEKDNQLKGSKLNYKLLKGGTE